MTVLEIVNCYVVFMFRADRQQMMAAAATEQPRPESGVRSDDARVGLIDHESAITADPFVDQNFKR